VFDNVNKQRTIIRCFRGESRSQMMAAMGCTNGYNSYWHDYNRDLIMRGAALAGLSWITDYSKELDEINRNKEGHPYKYGKSLISFVSRLRTISKLPFRMLEGMLTVLLGAVGIEVPCYSTLWKRCSGECVSAAPAADTRGRIVAVDSTGIEVTTRGGWMREKWKVHKGWIKLHALTDVHTNEVLSFIITDERSGDAKHLIPLVDMAVAGGHRITKVLADGAYDARYNWNGMRERGIEFVTNICRNAVAVSKGCIVRSRAVAERDRMGTDAWKKMHGYNMRWKVESAFSDYKRMFGESVSAKTFDNMVKEISRNIECFNWMKRIML